MFPHEDIKVHLSYVKRKQPLGSLWPLMTSVEIQEGTLYLDSLQVGCRLFSCTAALKIDTCPVLMGLTCAIFKAANVESAPSRLPEWAEYAVESARSCPLNTRIKGLVVICKLKSGRGQPTRWLAGQQWILPTGPCTFTPSNISTVSWNGGVF